MQEYIAPTPLFMLSLHHHGIRFSADSQGQYLPHLTSKPGKSQPIKQVILMKSSFYFLIIMNGLSCFTWQSHAAQMIRVTELQGHPNSQAQSEIQENILQPVLTNPLNLSFMTPPIFPWLL